MSDIKLLFGEEDFLVDEELNRLKAGKSGELSLERISGDKKNTEKILSALTSLPMLISNKLVIVDGLEYDEKNEKKLFEALQNLDKSISVIFVQYGSVDKRKKFYKLMEKIGEVKEFKGYSEWEQDKVLAWLVARVRHYSRSITGAAANLLVETVGANLRMLDKEIEKISTYIGNRKQIEEGDVLKLASSGEIDSFSLSNAMRDKDIREAMKTLQKLFRENEDPHMLIGMLAKLYRMLLSVKYLENKGKGQYDIANMLGSKPFFVKKCMEKTPRFTLEELQRNIKLLHEADLRMKSGYSPRLTLEMLIPELCRG